MYDSPIEWTNKACNPVKIICRHKCSWIKDPEIEGKEVIETWCYMFAKNFYNRLKGTAPYFREFESLIQEDKGLDLECLSAPKTKNKTIFVGSGTDIWGKWVPKKYKIKVVQKCNELDKSNTVIFLTKYPEGYSDIKLSDQVDFSENTILGVTIETDLDLEWYSSSAPTPKQRLEWLIKNPIHKHILVSVEPALLFSCNFAYELCRIPNLKWIILGFNTSRVKMQYPEWSLVEDFFEKINDFNEIQRIQKRKRRIKVLMKPNFAEWYDVLPSEYNAFCEPIKIPVEGSNES